MALKRQDPNPHLGMVTVGKELPTHPITGNVPIFGLFASITYSLSVTSLYAGVSLAGRIVDEVSDT